MRAGNMSLKMIVIRIMSVLLMVKHQSLIPFNRAEVFEGSICCSISMPIPMKPGSEIINKHELILITSGPDVTSQPAHIYSHTESTFIPCH